MSRKWKSTLIVLACVAVAGGVVVGVTYLAGGDRAAQMSADANGATTPVSQVGSGTGADGEPAGSSGIGDSMSSTTEGTSSATTQGSDQSAPTSGPSSVTTGTTDPNVGQTTTTKATSSTTLKSTATTKVPTTSTSTTLQPDMLAAGVRGVVVDLSTGAPIEGATVSTSGGDATTAADGTYGIAVEVRLGALVVAEKPGYIGAQRIVRAIGSDGWAEVRLELLSLSSPDAPPPPPGG